MDNTKIIKGSDAALFSMPSLDSELSRVDILKEAEEIQRSAYEEGFASGEKAGFSEGEQKASLLIERLENIISGVTLFKDELVDDLESQVVDLSVSIARRIITDEINTRPEFIVTMVKESLKRLQRVGNIRIKINPALYDLFMKTKPELMEVHEDIAFDVDSNVPVTGPLVISEIEEVVTDIGSMIKNIEDEIKGTDEVRAEEE